MLLFPPKNPHHTLMGVPLRVFVTRSYITVQRYPKVFVTVKNTLWVTNNIHFFCKTAAPYLHFEITSTLHSIMQVRAHNRENRARGGRRHYTYGATFELKKTTLLSAEGINGAFLATCACDPQCGWKCANELWNFTERIEDLRAPRFKGQSSKRPRRAHRSP